MKEATRSSLPGIHGPFVSLTLRTGCSRTPPRSDGSPSFALGCIRGSEVFLPPKSVLANVVDLEHQAMTNSLRHDHLFDFAATFPSLSQEFLLQALESLPLSGTVVRMARSLFFCYRGSPALEGHRADAIEHTAGIRRGCPLSPPLFLAVVDGLLDRIQRESPDSFVRVYADDSAVVVSDATMETPVL